LPGRLELDLRLVEQRVIFELEVGFSFAGLLSELVDLFL
jgi:hypothetical protein